VLQERVQLRREPWVECAGLPPRDV